MKWPDLQDCAGNRIPVDTCACGLPKLVTEDFCCDECPFNTGRHNSVHSGTCRLRSAFLGAHVPWNFKVLGMERLDLSTFPPPRGRFSRAMELGRQAALDGLTPAANPYSVIGFGIVFRKAWEDAYESALANP